MKQTVSDGEYHTIFAEINTRLFESALIDDEGNFIHEELDLVLFSVDANERKYRRLASKLETIGDH